MTRLFKRVYKIEMMMPPWAVAIRQIGYIDLMNIQHPAASGQEA